MTHENSNDVDVRSRDTDCTSLLDALMKITSHGRSGWNVNIDSIRLDNSAPLDYEVRLEYIPKNERMTERRVKIVPAWSVHPRYGEPDVFLGYRVKDDAMGEYDNVYADYLTFREACETTGKLIGERYKEGTRRVRDWRKQREYGRVEDIDNYDELREAGDEAIDLLVEYINDVKMEQWDEITRDEIEKNGEQWKTEIIGRAKAHGLVGFYDLADLSLVLDDLLFDVAVEA